MADVDSHPHATAPSGVSPDEKATLIGTLAHLWPRIVVGGFVILDEFGSALLPRVTGAHQEFFSSKGLTIAELPTGQGLVIKTRED